jgi:hypothetical protein
VSKLSDAPASSAYATDEAHAFAVETSERVLALEAKLAANERITAAIASVLAPEQQQKLKEALDILLNPRERQ